MGSLVLVKNMKKLTRKGGRMEPNWTGPYEVVECVSSNMHLPFEKKRWKPDDTEIFVQCMVTD